MSLVSLEFLEHDNVVQIAQDLLGCELRHTLADGTILSGIITETEAYRGPEDKASHAWNNRRTSRTEIMFGNAGTSYVYLCYGIHNLFNVVTNKSGIPHAVLIRGIFPILGLDRQLENRNKIKLNYQDFVGPGKVTKALEITSNHNNINLLDSNSPLQMHDKFNFSKNDIQMGKRVGIDYAEDWKDKLWRFWIKKELLKNIK